MRRGRLHARRRAASWATLPTVLLFLPLLVTISFTTPTEVQAQGLAKPKVMVVIEEKVAGVFGTTGWETIGQAESTLVEKLIAAGFPVVDSQTLRRNIPRDKALLLLQ